MFLLLILSLLTSCSKRKNEVVIITMGYYGTDYHIPKINIEEIDKYIENEIKLTILTFR